MGGKWKKRVIENEKRNRKRMENSGRDILKDLKGFTVIIKDKKE